MVVCKPEPQNGRKGAFKLRDHEQAQKDLKALNEMMGDIDSCVYGLWTNGLEFFFLKKESTRFDVRFKAFGDWPLADETIDTREVASDARMRRADPEMLRTAFRRCHNFIHGNEGMPKDAAFWQFLYLIFSKMHDQQQSNGSRRFWAAPTEQFDPEGRKKIRERIIPFGGKRRLLTTISPALPKRTGNFGKNTRSRADDHANRSLPIPMFFKDRRGA